MSQLFSNNASTALSGAALSTDLTLALTSATGFPAPSSPDYYYATIANATNTAWEIVKVTGLSGTTLTVIRAQDGTSAAGWPSGSIIEIRPVAQAMRDMQTNPNGPVNIANTTASTTTTTGALTIAGGLGVAGQINTGSLVAGNVGSANATATLQNNMTTTDPAATTYGFYAKSSMVTTADNAKGILGGVAIGNYAGANNLTIGITGLYGLAQNQATAGTMGGAYGLVGGVVNSGAGTITNAVGMNASVSKTAGAITNAYGIYVNAISAGATLNYAFFSNAGIVGIGDTTASTSTTSGALQVAGGIGVAGAAWFGGAVNLAASTGLVIPSGAPSTTTNTLYNSGGALYWGGTALGTVNLASPGPIGGTTPGTGNFTSLTIAQNGTTPAGGIGGNSYCFMTIFGKSGGSLYDFGLTNPGNTANYLQVPTGTNIPVFPQGLTGSLNGAVGATAPSTGVFTQITLSQISTTSIPGAIFSNNYCNFIIQAHSGGTNQDFAIANPGATANYLQVLPGSNIVGFPNGITVAGSIASTSTTTGSVIVTGGVGISGALNVGSATVTGTQVSSSVTTGSLVLGGGLGMGGNLWMSGNLYCGYFAATGTCSVTAASASFWLTETGANSSLKLNQDTGQNAWLTNSGTGTTNIGNGTNGSCFQVTSGGNAIVNKVLINAPTTSATLTLVNGSTLQTTGAYTLNLTTTAASTPTFPTGSGTLVYLGAANTWSAAQTLSVSSTFTQAAIFTAYAGGTTAGMIWQDSTQKALATYQDGLKQMAVGTMFTMTAAGTNGANTAITNILGTGVGTAVLPASWTLTGKTIRIRVIGTVTTAATPGTTVITLYLNAGTPVTVVASPSLTLTASMTSMPFTIEFDMVCRSTTSVMAGGKFVVSNSTTGITATAIPIGTTTAATVVAATSYTINVSATNGTASGTVYTTQTCTIEVLN